MSDNFISKLNNIPGLRPAKPIKNNRYFNISKDGDFHTSSGNIDFKEHVENGSFFNPKTSKSESWLKNVLDKFSSKLPQASEEV